MHGLVKDSLRRGCSLRMLPRWHRLNFLIWIRSESLLVGWMPKVQSISGNWSMGYLFPTLHSLMGRCPFRNGIYMEQRHWSSMELEMINPCWWYLTFQIRMETILLQKEVVWHLMKECRSWLGKIMDRFHFVTAINDCCFGMVLY